MMRNPVLHCQPNSSLSYLSSLPKPKASPFEKPATNTKLGKVHPQLPQAPTPSSPSKVKSYILVLQWQPGVCNGKSDFISKNSWQPKFSIHGLWPQFSEADSPVKSSEMFGDQIAFLTPILRTNWPTLKEKDHDLLFWSHEWYKHGAVSEIGLLSYFQKTLELFKAVGEGLDKKLDAEGIKRFGTYKLQDIEAALKKINDGFSCSIICVQSKIGNVQQIQEIRFSFTADFQKQNTVIPSTCTSSDVWFP